MAISETTQASPARKRNALGRGLSALMTPTAVRVDPPAVEQPDPVRAEEERLLSDGEKAAPEPVDGETKGGLVYLSLDAVLPNEKQPRQSFPEDELKSLADSVRETGLLQPIVVRPLPHAGPGKFEIVAGERRFRASKIAGMERVPALVKELSDKEALALAIVENVQRSNLNPIEEALAYRRLAVEFGESQETIAVSVGKDRVSISNALRLLKLPAQLQAMVVDGRLSAGHGRALLMLDDPRKQQLLADRVVKEGLSVRALERLAGEGGERISSSQKSRRAKQDAPVAALEERLRRALGTKVQLRVEAGGAGQLMISFFSKAELDALIERLGA